MMDLIMNNWDSILVIVAFVLVMLLLIKRGAIKQVNQMLFYLVTEAEAQFGGGTGALKFAAVTTWLYDRLPAIITLLFTDKQIDEMINKAVKDMQAYLDTNINAKLLIE